MKYWNVIFETVVGSRNTIKVALSNSQKICSTPEAPLNHQHFSHMKLTVTFMINHQLLPRTFNDHCHMWLTFMANSVIAKTDMKWLSIMKNIPLIHCSKAISARINGSVFSVILWMEDGCTHPEDVLFVTYLHINYYLNTV